MTGTRIFVVEDDQIVSRDIQRQLTRMQYEVVGSTGFGEEAAELAREARAQLVLMDIRLGGKFDGVQAAEQVRLECQIPVVFLTAYSDDETLRRAGTTQPFGYLLKPFEDSQLGTAIEMALYKHAADQRVVASERRYAATLSSIGDAVIATDACLRVAFANGVAEKLTGWTQGEASGRALADVFRIVDEETHEVLEGAASKVLRHDLEAALPTQVMLVRRDGCELPVDHAASPIIDERGALSGVVIVFRDLTRQRNVEQALQAAKAELERAARVTTMGELAASIAHEINQPLAAIVTSAGAALNWLSYPTPNVNETRAILANIVADAQRAADVIRSLRTLATKSGPQLGALDLDQAIRDVLLLTRSTLKSHDVRVRTHLLSGSHAVLADRVQIQQVMLNLIVNAIEAMASPNIHSRLLTIVSQRAAQGRILVTVSDSGVGLEQTLHGKVFEPFFTTKSNGMGMGLAICRSILEAHGGRFWLAQSPSQGTAFSFELPMVAGGGVTSG